MNTYISDITCSLDHPEEVLNSLRAILQQSITQQTMRNTVGITTHRIVLLIDDHDERARYLTHILTRANYRPVIMKSALEAFTRFLTVPFVPAAVILSQEDTANRLFLYRLLQQIAQRYQWEAPLVRLRLAPSSVSRPMNRYLSETSQARIPRVSGGLVFGPANDVSSRITDALGPELAEASLSRKTTSSLPSPSSQPLPFLSVADMATRGATSRGNEPLPKIALEGQNLGRYQILSPLGDDAHRNVYQAYDLLRERNIALKVLQTNSIPYFVLEKSMEDVTIFQLELDLLRGIEHPHILPLWNTSKSYISGKPFIYKTMPYCEEGSFASWLFQHNHIKHYALQDVAHVILQLADVLQYLHDHQIIYQNFKLSNLLLRGPAQHMRQLHLQLVDFAIPQNGMYLPKTADAFQYIAPERWFGHALPASDQYGLASLAYELLTGHHLFQGSTEHVMKHLHTNMQPQPPTVFNPAIPPALSYTILHALAKKPEERFPSIAAFARNIQRSCM